KKYKPLHRCHRPVPTYMPDPRAQQFSEIPELPPLTLPTNPPHYSTLPPHTHMSQEHLQGLLKTIEADLLTPEEVNLITYLVHAHLRAFTWVYKEKGYLNTTYFPPYDIPTVEHVPRQVLPVLLPLAIRDNIKDEVQHFEALRRFEPSTASYRSALWAVVKK
ncbi:hypothetical protein C8Q80DRAFT_1066571, partial [Daedaleopsis nitida]